MKTKYYRAIYVTVQSPHSAYERHYYIRNDGRAVRMEHDDDIPSDALLFDMDDGAEGAIAYIKATNLLPSQDAEIWLSDNRVWFETAGVKVQE